MVMKERSLKQGHENGIEVRAAQVIRVILPVLIKSHKHFLG
jgi:hypothetical protein